jgi:hypothetical protein
MFKVIFGIWFLVVGLGFANFEVVLEETLADSECSSSQWCIGFNEHCVNGQCVQKDPFNKCFSDFDCSLFDRCVDGVCVPK